MVHDKQDFRLASIDIRIPFIAERVPGTLKTSLDAEQATTQFYTQFQQAQAILQNSITGIASSSDRAHYASLLLNRLMFLYFIQKKGFLDDNINYLPDKLHLLQAKHSQNTALSFYSFYRHLLLRLFHYPLKQPVSELDELLGDIQHLTGGLFEIHKLERTNKNIHIPDEAFERIFTFFDSYYWQIAEQSLQHAREINPDVIGYVFEKCINQKQMGAYYTRADITSYISRNTLIPYLFQMTEQKCNFNLDGFIWQLLRNHPDRYISESVRSREYLPTESSQEYQERRIRYEALKSRLAAGEIRCVHDLITCNLDLSRYAHDAISACKSSRLLQAFYESITTMSILDPTCGSGAFLFAALDILAPLYEACLTRMTMMVTNTGEIETRATDLELFQALLTQVAKHPNRMYFILKAIIINNLYGVDIMGEAVEICKLRLFLKLITPLKTATEMGMLSDIDFNIHAGNALVGFSHYDDFKEAARNTVDSASMMDTMERKVHKLAGGLADLRKAQMRLNETPEDWIGRKIYLQNLYKTLQVKMHRYLAHLYGINMYNMPHKSDYERAFKAWCNTHQPFHWCIDFHSIMERGGFAVIIGNPPYVEYSKIRQEYTVQGYETESCGNLYAAVIERSLALSRPGESYLGLIVPLSICGGERFGQLRRTITKQTTRLWLANFEIFPSRLFEGAFQRLSILLAQHGITKEHTTCVTRIQRWYATERPHLINLITYTPTQRIVKADVFPRLAAMRQETILHKLVMKADGSTIATLLQPYKTKHFVYYEEATNYWMKATCCVPYYKKNGVVMEPAHGRFLYFGEEVMAHTIMVLMNSSLFYLWFATFSDGFHLSHTLVKEFPSGSDLHKVKDLAMLAIRLQEDIKAHARMGTRNTRIDIVNKREGHQIELEEYRMGASKTLLDDIDGVLACYYGLNDEELQFVLNYDRKYRMGKENGYE